MRVRVPTSVRRLWLLALTAALAAAVPMVASPAFADPCDNEKSADRALNEAQRAAERAQRVAEQVALQAQRNAERAAQLAAWAAEHASEQAQREAAYAQARAERAATRAQRDAERAARAAQRAAERAAIGSNGVVVTNDAILFLDGPEVPRDGVQWAEDARTHRMRRPVTTDTLFRVDPGVTLSLANLSGDIVVKVWDRPEVRVNAEHDQNDLLVAKIKDGQLKLGVRSRAGGEQADVEWNLTVPAWLPLEISGIESEIAVTGLRASVRAQSMRGDVRVSACQGPMELNSVEGEVHAEDVNGDVTAGSVNSIVRLVRVLGPIEAQSINGDIQMDDVSSANVSASTLNGQVFYASKFQPRGHYALSSHNGTLHVGVDDAQALNVTVSSFRAQVESSIPVPPAPPTAPTAPAPPAPMTWRTVKWSFPTEATSASTTTRTRWATRTRTSGASAPAAPHAPELELESFNGLIQLASRADVERALQIRQAMRDSAVTTRMLGRLRRLARQQQQGLLPPPEPPKPEETPEKH